MLTASAAASAAPVIVRSVFSPLRGSPAALSPQWGFSCAGYHCARFLRGGRAALWPGKSNARALFLLPSSSCCCCFPFLLLLHDVRLHPRLHQRHAHTPTDSFIAGAVLVVANGVAATGVCSLVLKEQGRAPTEKTRSLLGGIFCLWPPRSKNQPRPLSALCRALKHALLIS